jgi:hypothetical protein
MQVFIQLTVIGLNAGPTFDIFADAPAPPYTVAIATGVTQVDLLAGQTYTVDDAATNILIRSTGGVCDDLILPIVICTTTTTTTSIPTTTTTTTVGDTTTTTTSIEPTTTTTTTLERVDHLFFGSVFAEGTYTFSLDASPGVSQEISATLNVNIWEVQGVTPHADNPWIMPFTILNGQTTPVATINKTPAAPCVWTIADVSVTSMVPDIADVEYSGNVIYP